jgi:hypothetical protein
MSETRRHTVPGRPANAIPEGGLPHTESVKDLIENGRHAEATTRHTERVQAEFRRAAHGETINLTDLIAAKEELELSRPNVTAS